MADWKSDLIIEGGSGDPRRQAMRAVQEERAREHHRAAAKNAPIHGMTPSEAAKLNERFDQMMPKLVSSSPQTQRRDLFAETLPRGANWDARRSVIASGGGGSAWGGAPGYLGGAGGFGSDLHTIQRPYQPEFESPDRQQYPVHRILANRYWRLFIKMDPVLGTGLDMYGEMPFGEFKLTGEGVEGEVRDVFETMCEECNVSSLLPAMVREYLGLGEVIPHAFFDDDQGIWTHVALHNPDNLEVIDAPFIKMDPIVEFVPDDKLRQILTSSDPDLQKIRQQMPPELLSKLYSRQNIRVNTEVNATFIARKLHPYETRGTSILSRMWRIFMLEDGIFNATIATARRHAGPLKIAKLGNPQTNWIPGPEHERRFAELVAQAEIDPHAWIIFHYGLSLEAFGTTDRVMTIDKQWDVIERIKLAALGLSRSFLTGELTFASATAGLQVFLRRLLSLRNHFDSTWIRPKFFKPISEINNFVRPTKAETAHRIRVRRTAGEIQEDRRLIVPKVDWANKLNPMVDRDLISAYDQLERLGVRISKTKKLAAVNLSFEEELRRGIEEDIFEDEIRQEYGQEDEDGDPEELEKIIDHTDESKPDDEQEGGGAAGPAGPGAKEGDGPIGPDILEAPRVSGPPHNPRLPKIKKPVQKSVRRPAPPKKPEPKPREDGLWDERGQALGWDKDQVEGLVELLETGRTNEAFWARLEPRNGAEESGPYRAYQQGDHERAWEQIALFLDEDGLPDRDIEALRFLLQKMDVLDAGTSAALREFEASLPDDAGSLDDESFGNMFARIVNKQSVETPAQRRGHPFSRRK